MTLRERIGTPHALREYLRTAVGYPKDTVSVPDVMVDGAIIEGLEILNNHRPRTGVGTFQTVPGQQVYQPLPEGAVGLRHVWWPLDQSPGVSSWQGWGHVLGLLGQSLGRPINEIGTRTSIEPSAVAILARERKALSRLLGEGVTYNDRDSSEASVYLMPTPVQVHSVVFSYNTTRYATAQDCEGQDISRLLTIAEAALHRRKGSGAGAITEVKDGELGTAIKTDAAKHHMEMYRELTDRFHQMLPPPTRRQFP
ncbi:MAG: hypothetical protein ACE366_16595 [Bradymonadia bacterium]